MAANTTSTKRTLPILAWAGAFAIFEVAYLTRANHVFPLGGGHFWLFLLLWGAHGALATAAMAGADFVTRRFQEARAWTAGLVAGPWFLVTILALTHYRDRMNTRPRDLEGTLVTLGILAVFLLVYGVIVRSLATRSDGGRDVATKSGLAAMAIATAWMGTARPEQITLPAETVSADLVDFEDTGYRVLLVPLDGGAWEIFDPMLKAGRLPALQALIDRGITADLKTDIPTFSPIIWTSVATGKLPKNHGIHGFTRAVPPLGLPEFRPGTKRLKTLTKVLKVFVVATERAHKMGRTIYSANDWKARSVWSIVSEFGLPSVVLEWYVSHPARPILGISVSEHFHRTKSVESIAEELPNIVYPESLTTVFSPYVVSPKEIPDDDIFALLDAEDLDPDGRTALVESRPDWFYIARSNMARDLSTINLAEAAFPRVPDWRYGAVYFRAMDAFHHENWLEKDLPADDLDLHPERRYRTAIERYYEFCDDILARCVALADDRTIIMVMSDHGFEARFDHERAPDGFFVAAGGPIKVSSTRGEISIYDITPTTLALLGIPVPDDMHGTVKTYLANAEFWDAHPVGRVPSYEHSTGSESTGAEIGPTDEVFKELRALGYMD